MCKGDVNGTAGKTAGRFEHVNGSRDRLMRMVVDVVDASYTVLGLVSGGFSC